MNVILSLLLAHLLADFVLQPHSLIRLKEKNFSGVVLHGVIHFTIIIALLWPVLTIKNVVLGAIFIALIHTIIDQGKILYQRKYHHYVIPFFVDQILHLLTIGIVYLALGFSQLTFPESWNTRFLLALTLLIVFTMTYDLGRFQFRREKNEHAKFTIDKNTLGWRIFLAALIVLGFALTS